MTGRHLRATDAEGVGARLTPWACLDKEADRRLDSSPGAAAAVAEALAARR